MNDEYTNVTVTMDPRRETVTDLLEVVFGGQYGDCHEQALADVIMVACIIGELFDIKDEEQYLTMIQTATPNAKKAADYIASNAGI